jgi:hypothetical protein
MGDAMGTLAAKGALDEKPRAFIDKHILKDSQPALSLPVPEDEGSELAGVFDGLLREKLYADLPEPLRAELRRPVEAALAAKRHDARTAINDFKLAVTAADGQRTAWQGAAARLATVEQQLSEAEGWGAPEAPALKSNLATLKADAGRGAYKAATDALELLEGPVATAHKTAHAKSEWEAFEATPAFIAVQGRIKTLKAWGGGAATDADKRAADLAKLRDDAVIELKVAEAKVGLGGVQTGLATDFTAWKQVRQHNFAMKAIKDELAPISSRPIPGRDDGASSLKTQWDAFKAAELKIVTYPVTVKTDAASLDGWRTDYAAKGQALMTAYETGAGAPSANSSYWDAKFGGLAKSSVHILQKAHCVPPNTPAMAALAKEMNDLVAALQAGFSPTEKQRFADLASALDKAKQLIAARTAAADPAEVAFYAKYRKVQRTVEAADKVRDGTEPALVATFTGLWTPFKAKLDGAEADRFTWMTGKLDALATAADAVLKGATDALRRAPPTR